MLDTALREAHEEAGIERHLVKPLGYLGNPHADQYPYQYTYEYPHQHTNEYPDA
ncbi:MAG: NUDIX domain-containing protein, partial [Thermoplasmata archaeon]